MGRWFPAVLAVLVAALALGPTDGASAADRGDRLCAERTFRLVYRPHAPVPHLEVYAGDGKRFRKRDRIVYVDAFRIEGELICGDLDEFAGRFDMMQKKTRRFDRPTMLTCRPGSRRVFTDAAYPHAAPAPPSPFDPGVFYVTGQDRRIVSARFVPGHVNPDSPLLQYDGNVCTASRPQTRAERA
jgi:hypothetical protein